MEELLHYCWKHRLLPAGQLCTTDGQKVEVIDPGLPNRDAGPDFFNAKVKLDGHLWVGNVEIHQRSADWYLHGHDRDNHYDNVVLHVCEVADRDVFTANGQRLPQLQMGVPPYVAENYDDLQREDRYPPCHDVIARLPSLTVNAWLSALQAERLEQKTAAIKARVALANGSWEEALFATLARNYGFGINGEAMEQWAFSVPLQAAAHHRDDPFQIEALFMGQAGLLAPDMLNGRHRQQALDEGYFTRLRNEYLYLAHKFGLQPMDGRMWRFLRLRPQNFPHIRIAQMAWLYCSRKASLSQLVACTTLRQLEEQLTARVTPYWQTHYVFGGESEKTGKQLSAASVRLLIVNTVVPMLFAYGRYKNDERLVERAFGLLEELPAERNHIVRMWADCGLSAATAADSQALIQLKTRYCDRKDCLRCRFGYEKMKAK